MSAGFGFVTFAERSIAEQALESLNGQVLPRRGELRHWRTRVIAGGAGWEHQWHQ